MAAPEETQERVESDLAPDDDNDSSLDIERQGTLDRPLLPGDWTLTARFKPRVDLLNYVQPSGVPHYPWPHISDFPDNPVLVRLTSRDIPVGIDAKHQWLTIMLDDKLYAAPIGDNPEVGPSRPTLDMADEFPSAEVIGTDISPTQPSWVPPNLSFQIDDAQLDWTFTPESFDFIHIRYMHAAIADWPRLYEQVYQFLKPGGWFQHIEPNIELRCDNPDVKFDDTHVFRQWSKLFYDAGDKIGRTFRFNEESMVKYARDAGFSEITHKKFTIPHGPWPKDKRLKEMGMYVGMYMNLSLDGFAVYPIGQILGWSLQEVQILVAKMRAAIKDPNNRTCSDMHMVYGRKPEHPTTAPSAAAEAAPSLAAAASSPTQAQATSSPARRP
ncbi:hypothetical protein DL770_004565 [Monosporascus sp. CRB-9-2]|nr:hypothetical protein DL770_004565 [Monosporascus sp. CRB-9-2]